MPAESRAQQQKFAICLHKPRHARGKCPDMSKAAMREFAATPTTGLPKKLGAGGRGRRA